MEKPEGARRLGVQPSPYSANSDAQARRSQRLRTESGEGWGAEGSFGAQRSHCLSSPASSSCSRSQTTGCAAGALHPLAFRLFRFRPALHSPPISLSVWERGHLRGRRFGSSASPGCCLRCCHLLRQAGVCGGPRGGGGSGGGSGGSDMEPEAGGRSSARRHGAGPPSTPPPREQERKLEQEKLSGVVKSVHRRLRKKYREVGDFDKIWREHCEDEETLCEYAVAMKNLADNHWAKTCEGEGRIEWCCSVCREYFQNGGKRKALEKDEKRAVLATKTTPALNTHESSKLEGHLTNLSFTNPEFITELLQTSGKIRLLDVGSCFNPFLKFEEFLTVGIDIVPAVESVYKCDFLNLQLQQPLQLAQDAIDAFLKQLKNPIDSLPGELFHVVVFSLLLSYFPSPYQRWICCKKAHELLVLNGLLLIITPDSSHQNRHAMMMKSWKIAIESLGFKRFKYSKFSHMHLMAFRKISLKTTSDLVSRNYPGMLYIPQDFNSIEEEEYSNPSCYVRSDTEDEQLAYGFTELPDAPYDSDSGESQASSIPFYELEDPILLLS
ncbi:S-adenosylmethionine sensor upstream of mTORC1 [Mustela erminea]|uniref:S-adenosylmethionine sensor upstream of mTORC1 n=1 Tax=Mustela erminea TaxID=36723 RepID=UPI0013872C5E|nr:S-adenosylmethionine sensor upstream of mTORC1 [Mustela erminea]